MNAGRLSKSEFLRILKKAGPLKFVLVQPSKLRLAFTDFVIRNRDLAMEMPESMVGMGGDLPMDMSIGSGGMSLQARGFGKSSNRDPYGKINHSANESGLRSKRKKSRKG